MKQIELLDVLQKKCQSLLTSICIAHDEVTVECHVSSLLEVLLWLRDEPDLQFEQLMDLCVVDYLTYGVTDWETEAASNNGFSRAVGRQPSSNDQATKPRFAVVYHFLSITKNQRLRLKVSLEEDSLFLPSAHMIWKVANWFEREAYDLFGVFFEGHPDLRRILTDYGFIGHPFRKDFPVSGHVEMRYDATLKKVIYVPVDIVPRISVPKVIREDNRYIDLQEQA